ncbi:MAG TPA: hypothetical protein VF175_00235, partial [Lacipirellula sp.]
VAFPEQPESTDAFATPEELAPSSASREIAEATSSVFDGEDEQFAAINDPTSAPPVPQTPMPTADVGGWSASKFAAMLVSAAIAGAAVVGVTISWLRDDPVTAAGGEKIPSVAAPTSPQQADIEEQSQGDPPLEAEPAAVEVAKPIASEAFLPIASTSEEAAPPQPSESEITAAEVEEPSLDAAASQQDATSPKESLEVAADAAPIESEPEPRLRIDPLDVDPEGLDLAALYAGPPKDPLAESQLPAEDGPSSSSAAIDAADIPAEAPPAALQAVRRDEQAGGGKPAAVDALLARRLPEVSVDKTPLCRFLDLAVQISGLPVSVDPVELRMAAVTAATPVSVDVTDATTEQLLASALEPLRLTPVIDGEHILLKRSGEDARRNVDYPVNDLAGSPEKAKQLGDWVTRLASPAAWSHNGGDATLVVEGDALRVEAPTSVQYQVLFLLERYRLARGLPARTKYPRDLLPTEPAHAALAERLSAPAQFTFSHYTPLREVFRFWQEELEVAVLVDWPVLAGERLWPQSTVACSAADAPWDEAMDSVLQPLGLAWRAVGPRTIEITSLATVNAKLQLEIYRVRSDASLDGRQLAERIQSLVAGEDAAQPADGTLLYDADSRILFAMQPAAVHRRIVAGMSDVLKLDAEDSAR